MELWLIPLYPVRFIEDPHLRIGDLIRLLVEPGRPILLRVLFQIGLVISLLLLQPRLYYMVDLPSLWLQSLHSHSRGLFGQDAGENPLGGL
jgi:hypothetical protein